MRQLLLRRPTFRRSRDTVYVVLDGQDVPSDSCLSNLLVGKTTVRSSEGSDVAGTSRRPVSREPNCRAPPPRIWLYSFSAITSEQTILPDAILWTA